jgi:DNA-binding transcriptional MerR regulator
MIKIGDFSKLSQVSVRALRYYEEMGLLKPVEVDRFTGYRYYSVDQLPRLNRILALKDLGLSLEQIAQLLAEGIPPAQLRGMLRMKQAEIQHQVGEEQARLARVEARLRHIEQEGKMPTYDVVIKKVEPQLAAAMRRVIPAYREVGQLYGELFAHLGRHGGRPAGPPLAIYHDLEFRERDADVEAAVPLAAPLPGSEQVSVRELPGIEQAASMVFKGAYEGISDAYSTLLAWTGTNGYRIAGPVREVYLRGPESGPDSSSYVTEVQVPVEKA